jgi:hypothetical protein
MVALVVVVAQLATREVVEADSVVAVELLLIMAALAVMAEVVAVEQPQVELVV